MIYLQSVTELVTDALIRVKVRAHNSQGWGAYSDLNVEGQLLETLPLAIAPITIDYLEVTNEAI